MRAPRSVLITGASAGIGAALAEEYAAPGVHLSLGGRDAARLAAVAARCRGRGAMVVEACVDVTDAAAVAAWVEAADAVTPVDLVIANAGVQGGLTRGGVGETREEVERVMQINFGGVCNTVYAALPAMRRRGRGQIALIASLAALRGLPVSPGYCASKAAVWIYGESLRSWLAAEGIEVSIVLPGFVDTRMSQAVSSRKPLMIPPEQAAQLIRRRLAKGRARIVFPRLLHLGVYLLRGLPPRLGDRVLRSFKATIGPYR